MRAGEIAQDRWGKWHWPIDTIAQAFRQRVEATYLDLTHCPFCDELLPNVSYTAEDSPPRNNMDVTDGGQDGEGGES